ncbi:MAG: HAMP domain-containing histidine kinase [Bacteroidales bacterium]|nr:HAMP domain-containing histidine kinase [Bacteroidales bacterium]
MLFHWTRIIALVVVLTAFVLLYLFRRGQTTRRLRQLAKEAEVSKQQIIVEQQRNQQLKQEMTNNIAHELKTPVSSIRGYLEILLSDSPVTEDKRRYFLDRCYQQTLRLSDLINDVSLINKLVESSSLFPVEEVMLRTVVDEAIHDLSDKAATARINIENTIADTVVVEGNKNLLYAIFRNLIENAVSYAGEDITVGIECYRENPDRYYLHFYDTGCGVDNQYMTRIFDRFLRIDSGRSRKNGGTGLGLSIVKHAVQFHGGDIYAKNRDEGGLEFFFSLKR